MNPQEQREEGLARLKVAVRAQAREQGVQEGLKVRDGSQRSDFEVDVRRRERFKVFEEGLVCGVARCLRSETACEGATARPDSQGPSLSSASNRRTKSVSTADPLKKSSFRFAGAASLAAACLSSPLDGSPKSKRLSTPGKVGRKKGARSGAFGASFGLFRALIVSRLRSVCHRARGMSESVRSESASWSGVV